MDEVTPRDALLFALLHILPEAVW